MLSMQGLQKTILAVNNLLMEKWGIRKELEVVSEKFDLVFCHCFYVVLFTNRSITHARIDRQRRIPTTPDMGRILYAADQARRNEIDLFSFSRGRGNCQKQAGTCYRL